MSDKMITMPDRDEMLRRLRGELNEENLVHDFYPLILVDAGRTITGPAVVLRIQLAIAAYAAGSPETYVLLQDTASDYVKALIDDEEALEEAREMMHKARKKLDET